MCFMKIKVFLPMLAVAVAVVLGFSSCGSDDDDADTALASQVIGSYTGEEVLTVMGDDTNSTTTYEFTKSSDISVDMTIPSTAGGGPMALPALPVKNITLLKSGNAITGKISSFSGTVVNADGAEKSYSVSNMVAIFSDKAVVVTYELKYGNMPFAFIGKFTGTKK